MGWSKQELADFTTDELLEKVNYFFGYDPYYADLRKQLMEELKRRLEAKNG